MGKSARKQSKRQARARQKAKSGSLEKAKRKTIHRASNLTKSFKKSELEVDLSTKFEGQAAPSLPDLGEMLLSREILEAIEITCFPHQAQTAKDGFAFKIPGEKVWELHILVHELVLPPRCTDIAFSTKSGVFIALEANRQFSINEIYGKPITVQVLPNRSYTDKSGLRVVPLKVV